MEASVPLPTPEGEGSSSQSTKAKTVSLATFANQLLQEVGVSTKEDKSDAALFQHMDRWLGLYDDNTNSSGMTDVDFLTVEDCAPFSAKVYEVVSSMLIYAWNPADASPATNVLIQELHRLQENSVTKEEDLIEAIRLDCIPAVRVTKWIRQWMECNVDETHSIFVTGDDEALPKTFSQYLLLGQPNNDDNSDESLPSYSEALMQAIFIHMTMLPTYQSQLLLFNQAFQRGDFTGPPSDPKTKNLLPTTSTTALKDPARRLRHYQLAQQLSQKLTQEYNAHLQRMEGILGEWYRVAIPLRPLARAGLGRIWVKFLLQNTSHNAGYAPSLRGENTSASGLDVTLRVLYRILLGMPDGDEDDKNNNNETAALLDDLLFHQLLPLHQPNAMVLWRDQTSLLELYHEPLVQCTAFILKRYPANIGPVCQALLTPSESIWPVGGNTPKQVLLLHEVDTYLGMLLPPSTTKKSSSTLEEPTQEMLYRLDEPTFVSILSTIAQCMASEHSRLAERALTLFRNAYFKRMVMEEHFEASLRVILPTLTRSSSQAPSMSSSNSIPWNPTVRKMTFHCLKNLQQNNPDAFAKVCGRLFGNHVHTTMDSDSTKAHPPSSTDAPVKSPLLAKAEPQSSQTPSSNPAFNQRFSLQAGMGTWRPPPSAKQSQKGSASGRHTNMPPPFARPPSGGSKGGVSSQPPLSVTGVAPWANNNSNGAPPARKNPPSTITGVAPWASNQKPPPKNPPLTVTGVAPWAAGPSSGRLPPTAASHGSQKRPGAPPTTHLPPKQPHTTSPQHPPLHPPTPPMSPPKVSEGTDVDSAISPTLPSPIQEAEEESEGHKEETNSKDSNPGLARVLYYMDQCKPQGMDENEDENASSSWSKAQMSETPTLLPDLKFHDLVFGHELGHGSFGVVKYARLIDRTKTRSHWPEYAIKIIATEKMKELGYESSVAREIACLHLISHPNVARLVSSFRFQQGAYLVLEYASGGDLHQLLQQHGSLDVPSCQFVLGEITAALASLHELGFVYGDLKPENIVLSETGHVKLTDFGGCRPATERAREMLQSQIGKSGKNLLDALREGDPRKLAKQQAEQESSSLIEEEEEEQDDEQGSGWMSTEEDSTQEKAARSRSKLINDDTMQVSDDSGHLEAGKEDHRIEGTTAYLPPEVVMGSIPTTAADSWALGCVLYQCLSGRPPILEADDEKTRDRIVTFENTAGDAGAGSSSGVANDDNDPLFGKDQKHAADITGPSKALIRALLDRVPLNRPSMQQVSHHEFFDGQDIMQLYQKPAYPLDVGGVAPGPPDAQWSRRQFSSIWAPQPHAYDISGANALKSTNAAGGSVSSAPIVEADEAGSSFSHSNFYRAMNTYTTTNGGSTSATEGTDNTHVSTATPKHNANAGFTQQTLGQIEEDDVSMASSADSNN